jgi:hypothetical protein
MDGGNTGKKEKRKLAASHTVTQEESNARRECEFKECEFKECKSKNSDPLVRIGQARGYTGEKMNK